MPNTYAFLALQLLSIDSGFEFIKCNEVIKAKAQLSVSVGSKYLRSIL